MGKEIERKFLVAGRGYRDASTSVFIHQGFLSSHKERIVRIRLMGNEAFLTIKGINSGISRAEFEYPIPTEDAREMLQDLCEKPTIEKTRFLLKSGKHTWEVDEFHGDNEGLVVAEIELSDPGEKFEKPDWVGDEVTNDPKYFNASLIKNPFKNW